MHNCLVCGNKSSYTNVNRKGVRYHGFPKDENMKKVWFKVLGIDGCRKRHRICSDHFLYENYKSGIKKFLRPNAIPQPYDRNGFPSNYASQSNDVETGNNVILPMETIYIIRKMAYYDESDYIESEFYREENIQNGVVNNFESPILTRTTILTRNNEDMPDHTIASGLQCSVKNCLNRRSENLCLFRYPKDKILRNIWMDSCGITRDAKISGKRVCSVHFEEHCFTNTALKNRLKRGSVPSLFLDNVPDALPVSINEVPVLSTVEDQFISQIDNEAAEQSSEEENNDEIDNTNNTSMIIDLTIDDSSDSSLSITLEPDFTGDVPGFIFKMSKEVVLPNLYWKAKYLKEHNAAYFNGRDSHDVTIKKVIFYNDLVPIIKLYGKKYEHNTPIRKIKDVEDLLETIDSFMKCYGRGGFVFNICKGYIDNGEDGTMCSACQGLVTDEDLQRTKARIEARNKVMESYNNRIAEKKETVLELRNQMTESKKNQQQSRLITFKL